MIFGADPEFVILDDKDRPIPAHNLGFTKEGKNPLVDEAKFPGLIGGGWFKRDGFMLEMNPQADDCRGRFLNASRTRLQTLAAFIASLGPFHIDTKPSFEVDLGELLKDCPPDVMEFGCEPSFDAYRDGKERTPNIKAKTHAYRYGGGHLHFSDFLPEGEKVDHVKVAKLLDVVIGLPLSIIFDRPDEFKRREVYGAAGDFRPTKYYDVDDEDFDEGIEYRTPSPRIWNHHALMALFMGSFRVSVKAGLEIWDKLLADKDYMRRVQKAINENSPGLELVQEIPGFYSADTIRDLAKLGCLQRYSFHEFDFDAHSNWPEHAQTEFITSPGNKLVKGWNIPHPKRGEYIPNPAYKPDSNAQNGLGVRPWISPMKWVDFPLEPKVPEL